MSKPRKIVIFDMDGVIITQKGALTAFQQAVVSKKFGWNEEAIRGLDPMVLLRLMEGTDSISSLGYVKGIYEKFKYYIPKRRKRISFFLFIGLRVRKYEKMFSDFYPGVEEIVKKLHEAGVIMGICTNAEGKRTDTWLKKLNLDRYIKNKTSRDMKKKYGLKPSPGLLYALLIDISKTYNINIDRKNVYFVGDNVSDIRAAKNGSIKSIAVYSGNGVREELEKEKPDYLIKDVSELVKIKELFE